MKGLILLTLAVAMCTICGRPNTSKAEAKAKQSCQENVHSSYCGNVKPSSEASYYR